MCFGSRPPAPVPPPPPPPPASIITIGSPDAAGGYGAKKKRSGMQKLQIPLSRADSTSGLGIPGV